MWSEKTQKAHIENRFNFWVGKKNVPKISLKMLKPIKRFDVFDDDDVF